MLKNIGLCLGILGVALCPLTCQAAPDADLKALHRLTLVAEFAHQVTGVAVTPDGRIFVNFPRWNDDAPVSVAEVGTDGKLKPYPDAAWNAWSVSRKLKPQTHFICVQSVYADGAGNLWVLDPAAPGTRDLVANGPKLVRISLATGKVTQNIPFASAITPQGSYLNDIRLTPDKHWGFITDSGRGALVVVDIQTGKSRRLFDKNPALLADPDVILQIDGKPLVRANGKPMSVPSDGLAVDPQGEFVYWQALTGKTLYRAPVKDLTNGQKSEADLAKLIEKVEPTHPADGLWFAKDGELYATALESNGITAGKIGEPRSLYVQDGRLRWPDSLAQGADGKLYVTASHIQDTVWFHAKPDKRIPYSLWRVD